MTPRQRELYDFIAGWLYAQGFAPSYREMQAALGFKSKSQICWLLDHLEADGHITRDARRARSLKIVKQNAITLDPDIIDLADKYAAALGVSRNVATNQLLREALAE